MKVLTTGVVVGRTTNESGNKILVIDAFMDDSFDDFVEGDQIGLLISKPDQSDEEVKI